MIRKVRVELATDESLTAVAAAVEALVEPESLPAGAAEALEKLEAVLEHAREAGEDLIERLNRLDRTKLAEVELEWDADEAELSVEVEVNLRELAEYEGGDEAFTRLRELLIAAKESDLFACGVRLGVRLEEDVDEALAELDEVWAEYQAEYEEEEEEETWRTEGRRSSESGSWGGGSWGGLGDEEVSSNLKGLSKDARFFLEFAGLSWPTDAAKLKSAWRTANKLLHPDVTKDALPGLLQRLNAGHAELERELEKVDA